MKLSNLFKGRLNRRNLLFGILSSAGVMAVIAIPLAAMTEGNGEMSNVFLVIFLLMAGVAYLFNFSLIVRRWHDLGKSGWWVLLQFIPYINAFILLYLLLTEGEKKKNMYGPVPAKDVRWPQDILGNE